MHNLAMALQRQGHQVTGSDDEIYEPSRSRLQRAALLPDKMGWDANRIDASLDAIILGMHAREDNPELVRALQLGLRVYSFPEFVREMSEEKVRVVIAGSHGKTSTTSMIMHVLREESLDFDYLVGAQLPGFDLMVRLSDAPVIIIEGDEYLSSPVDRRPKFLHYEPQITTITGIAWDHMNVFPTFEFYVDQFRQYLNSLSEDGTAYYYENDELLTSLANETIPCEMVPYHAVRHEIAAGQVEAVDAHGKLYPLQIYGQHNLENMRAAMHICADLGIGEARFLTAMGTFKGAAMRLQPIIESAELIVLRDFAHAPSKVKATTAAVRERYPDRHITALVELHTYSSLNKAFLPEYLNSLQHADRRIVFFSPHTIEMKKLEPISDDEVAEYFGDNVEVYTDPESLWNVISPEENAVHLWMSSGRFGNLDIDKIYA